MPPIGQALANDLTWLFLFVLGVASSWFMAVRTFRQLLRDRVADRRKRG